MKLLPSHDVPRPTDSSRRCVERILLGQNHAVVDLIDALERECDPRFFILDKMMKTVMRKMIDWPNPNNIDTACVTFWHQLAVACVRVMNDNMIAAQARAMMKTLAKQAVHRENRPA